ncbi:ROK family protein [Streptococcus pyogenes]|uniref:ROK family protein n=1 Tax=Streptococcus pyogenes TaxID=1314 RepID=UPI000DA3845E|nr:ROK family protein [Streptococcus pyogenes]SQG94314.1 ROK family protein [Streptococcus pyogenes]HEP1624799.1 ROK family protein [Streptococcus pyogenes]HEQ0962846.1 ROK family protein [Streptococcus pyogenes]HEQ1156963.1 ROK family protein [Streptococcus pyogenes]HER2372242.1 ROK family protein [Streptococcus pyogenes]
MKHYLAIDIGGTAIKYGLISETGDLLEKEEMATEAYKGGSSILEKVKGLVKTYQDQMDLAGVAISSAGMVNPDKGEIFYAGPQIPNYAGTQFKKEIEETFGLPCEVENDVNCAGLAEAISGSAKDYPVALCLTIGTGIGGCLLFNSQVFHGSSHSACEVGYLHLSDGQFQDLASTTALVQEVALAYGDDISQWDGRRIFEQAKAGDAICIAAISKQVDYLGQGIANICYVVNPNVVVLGGGIMAQKDYLADKLKTALDSYLVSSLAKKTQLKFASHGNNAGILGAYYHFKQKNERSCSFITPEKIENNLASS